MIGRGGCRSRTAWDREFGYVQYTQDTISISLHTIDPLELKKRPNSSNDGITCWFEQVDLVADLQSAYLMFEGLPVEIRSGGEIRNVGTQKRNKDYFWVHKKKNQKNPNHCVRLETLPTGDWKLTIHD